MVRGINGTAKCPKCGGKLTYYVEKEENNSGKIIKYVLKCRSCGYREVLQEIVIKRTSEGVIISVPMKFLSKNSPRSYL